MESVESSTKINLKLLIDKSNKRVLFAEAGKDFADFLFGLLELPFGAILRLLVERGMVRSWSIAKVYEAIQTIDPIYFETNQTKVSLLNPKWPLPKTKPTPMLQQFGCIEQQTYNYPRSSQETVGGYVKGMVTYMVTDDLTVKPMSSISCITILKTFQVRDVECLEERTVEIDMEMALNLVKASFASATVLTDVFLKAGEISITKIRLDT